MYNFNSKCSSQFANIVVPDIHSQKFYRRINNVCFFKSHKLPNPKYKKVIYIVRDGRDAMLSYFRMHENMGLESSMESYFSHEIENIFFGGHWSNHVQSWLNNPYKSSILYIRYEDLKMRSNETMNQIAKFINAPNRTNSYYQYVYQATSFKKLRSQESSDEHWQKLNQKAGFKKDAFFTRKGEIGAFKYEVEKSLIERFQEVSAKQLEYFDYLKI
jgi:hypothetical protein